MSQIEVPVKFEFVFLDENLKSAIFSTVIETKIYPSVSAHDWDNLSTDDRHEIAECCLWERSRTNIIELD